jgi:hypothetical protein
MDDLTDRNQFLNMAALFEGSLVAVAFFLGWLVDLNPTASLQWSVRAFVWGVGGAVPMFLLFLVAHYFAVGPFRSVKRFLVDTLGPSLDACHWYDLILLSLLAGVTEELLFRGVLQPWLEQWGTAFGLTVSNLLFGLAHAITPLYAVLAGLSGAYLGWLFDASGDRNLLTPIVTHTVYDYLAFVVVLRTYRHHKSLNDSMPDSDEQSQDDSDVTSE